MKPVLLIIGTWFIQDAVASICYYPTEKWRWNHSARLVRAVMGVALVIMGVVTVYKLKELCPHYPEQ